MNRSTSRFFFLLVIAFMCILRFSGPFGFMFEVVLIATFGLFVSRKQYRILNLVFLALYFVEFVSYTIFVEKSTLISADVLIGFIENIFNDVIPRHFYEGPVKTYLNSVQVSLIMGYFIGFPLVISSLSLVIDRMFRIRRRVGVVFNGIR